MTFASSRKWPTALLVGLVATCLCAIPLVAKWWDRNLVPVRASEAAIRDWLRQRTPYGCTREAVIAEIDEHKWKVVDMTAPGPAAAPTVVDPRLALTVELGSYRGFPLIIHVSAEWEFNEDDRLVRIEIHKVSDAP
jgi:hypothetical protein